MKLISIFFIVLVIVGIILYLYLNSKDTFNANVDPSMSVDPVSTTSTTQPSTTQPSTFIPIVEIPIEPVITFPEYMTKEQYNSILGVHGAVSAKLTSITDKFNTFLEKIKDYNSNDTEPTIEPFIDTITLNSEAFPDLKSYAEIYNKNVALLDDPNQLKKKIFDNYIYMQNNKLEKMREDLLKLQTKIQENKKATPSIKSFKSMNNSQSFNIELYNEVNPNNSSNRSPNYLIYGNNGCLEYIKKNGNEMAEWNFNSCDANNKNQQFVSTTINNLETYNSFINNDNQDRKLKDNTNTLFGFNVITPIDTQDHCLQLNNEGLSVMPCTIDFSQRFRESYSTVIP